MTEVSNAIQNKAYVSCLDKRLGGVKGRFCTEWRMLPGVLALATIVMAIILSLLSRTPTWVRISYAPGGLCTLYLIHMGWDFKHLKTFQESNVTFQANNAQLDATKKHLETNNGELQKKITTLSGENKTYRDENEALKKTNVSLSDTKIKLEGLQVKLKTQIEDLQSEQVALQTMITSLQSNIQALQEENKALQQTKAEIDLKRLALIATHEEQKTEWEKKSQIEEARFLQNQKMLETATLSLTTFEKTANQDHLTFGKEIDALQAVIQQLKTNADTLGTNEDGLQTKVLLLLEKMESIFILINSWKTANQELLTLLSMLDKCKEQLNTLNVKIGESTGTLDEKQKQINYFEDLLVEQKKQIDAYQLHNKTFKDLLHLLSRHENELGTYSGQIKEAVGNLSLSPPPDRSSHQNE